MKFSLSSLLSSLAFLLLLFMMVFTLSSKVDYTDPGPIYDDCADFNHADDVNSSIYINFLQNQGYDDIPHRNTGWESHIPYHDIRMGYDYPESSLNNNNDSFYCVIRVSTPNCNNWNWETIMNNGNRTVNIKLPKEEYYWDVSLSIEYYERCSDGSYSAYDSSLLYRYSNLSLERELYNNGMTLPVRLWFSQQLYCYNF